jgi:citrate lyase beta subunit
MLVSRAFIEAFELVHQAFRSSPAEIEEAKAIARADMDAAQRSYFATAAMIRAGWKPLEEHASTWIARTQYVDQGERRAA